MNLDQHCRDYEKRFSEHWPRMICELNADGPDAFWLIRHASYLFRTGGVRWGMDLTLRTDALMDFTQSRAAQDLSSLRFILTTHFHSDHFDARFCAQLSGSDTLWIVPDFAPEEKKAAILAAHKNVRLITLGDEMTIAGHTITVLPGHHYDDGGTDGIAAYSYAVKTPTQTLFCPGDVRDFRTCMDVDCPHADVLLGHVWLGRTRAQLPYEETFLNPYCDYLARANAGHIYLAHLNNYSRPAEEMWDEHHALAVAEGLKQRRPDTPVTIPRLGCMQAL